MCFPALVLTTCPSRFANIDTFSSLKQSFQMRHHSWKKLSGRQISAGEHVSVTVRLTTVVAGPNSCKTVGQCQSTRNMIPPIAANHFCVQIYTEQCNQATLFLLPAIGTSIHDHLDLLKSWGGEIKTKTFARTYIPSSLWNIQTTEMTLKCSCLICLFQITNCH